jgi:predicted ATPase
MITRVEQETPGWKLITAAREILGDSITEISLDALSESESRQMVANLLEVEALPEVTRSLILRKSEGNPFFVEEVIRMLIDRQAIVQSNGDWIAGENITQIEIPDNLQGLLMARIDRLPEDVRHTLRVASVVGRQFPVKVLEQVLGVKLQ